MPPKVPVHHRCSTGSVHAEERRFRSACLYGRKGGPGRQPRRLWDTFLFKEAGQQSQLLLGKAAVFERVRTHDPMTPIITLNANGEPLLLRSCLRPASKE